MSQPESPIVCRACGLVAAPGTVQCSRCGQSILAPRRWYHNVWVMLFLLGFVLGPFGLPLVWKHPTWSTTWKWTLTALTLLYTAWLVLVSIQLAQTLLASMGELPPGF